MPVHLVLNNKFLVFSSTTQNSQLKTISPPHHPKMWFRAGQQPLTFELIFSKNQNHIMKLQVEIRNNQFTVAQKRRDVGLVQQVL